MKLSATPVLPAATATTPATCPATPSQEQSRRAAAAIDAYLQAGPAPAAGLR